MVIASSLFFMLSPGRTEQNRTANFRGPPPPPQLKSWPQPRESDQSEEKCERVGVCSQRGDLELRCCAVEWLLRTGERKRDNSARSHPGESGEHQLWQRRRWQESFSERLSRKHWEHGGQHQPGE